MNANNFSGKVSFIWSVADLLRGPYRQALTWIHEQGAKLPV
jgi:hypothetical protein